MSDRKLRSAYLKLERAKELSREVSVVVDANPPYTYVLETNTKTGERATFAKINQTSIDKIVILGGDLFHNLRSALDHAYWEIVSPHVADAGNHKNIQFPFAKDSKSLDTTMKKRLADQVSQEFFDAVLAFNPHAGIGGNVLLNLVHETNIVDKHKIPIPVGDFTKLSSEMIRRQVPDFPQVFNTGSFGGNRRDVVWKSKQLDQSDLGDIVPPYTCLFHKQLDVPVMLVFSINDPRYTESLSATFQKMIREIELILQIMSDYL